MSILIVDDSEEERTLLSEVLRRAGYGPLLFADSAHRALGCLGLSGHGEVPSVDAVLVDVMMPGIDGLAFCRRVREEEHYAHLPLIIVTAKTDAADITAAYTAGASDYIRKPVIAAELIARVSMAITLKQELDDRIEREHALTGTVTELGRAVAELKSRKESMSVCCKCKRVRTAEGIWQRIEDYLEERLDVGIASAVCGKCEPAGRSPHG
ncbi:response regulator [Nitrospira moscoviensis]|jgi:phosphoserine phosphatase RsbU/P|uniref:Putative Response regulator, CheY-like n=1 Tax=Nitrospira moscoviensis TaxID=42253 RepID=A0A0K2GD68_NITMO|nr:response regulator [Nitrospira moscoviensis]ALA58547.1 putative Response regulator, CheY-like [Nitrospira moscoviensis]